MLRRITALCAVLMAAAAPAAANTVQGVGSNFHRALGLGYLSGPVYPPATVQLPETPATFGDTTALLTDGELLSWGGNAFAQVGDGRQWVEAAFPVRIARNIVQSTGDCALTSSNVVEAWGGNTYGQAGQGISGGGNEGGGIKTAVASPTPVKGLPPGLVKETICKAPAHYVLYANGNLEGWGNNSQSELGGPAQLEVLKPRLVATGVVEAVAEGASKYEDTVLMRHSDGSVWVLGTNNRGQAGIGHVSKPLSKPTRVLLPAPAVRVVNSHSNSGALLADGSFYVWGREDGTGVDVPCGNVPCDPTPHPVVTAQGASSVAVGFSTGYAVVNGALVSWGTNSVGQLDAPAKEAILPPAVRAAGVLRVAAQEAGALLETTAAPVALPIKATGGPGLTITVRWTGGTGKFNVGLAECTGGPKERSTKSKSVGRTEQHEFTIHVAHAGEWEASIAGAGFPRRTVRVTVANNATARRAR